MAEKVSLRDYVDTRFDAQKEAVSIAMLAADRATVKADLAIEKRFDNTNEWRGTLENLQRTYMPRSTFDAEIRSILDKIEGLQKLMWIGLGLVLTCQFFLGIGVILWSALRK
jgi:hypothetical protein